MGYGFIISAKCERSFYLDEIPPYYQHRYLSQSWICEIIRDQLIKSVKYDLFSSDALLAYFSNVQLYNFSYELEYLYNPHRKWDEGDFRMDFRINVKCDVSYDFDFQTKEKYNRIKISDPEAYEKFCAILDESRQGRLCIR